MRSALLLLVASSIAHLAAMEAGDPTPGVTLGIWNHQLLVTAPAGGENQLPGGSQRLAIDWRGVTLTDAADFLRQATRLNVVVMPDCGERTLSLTVTDMPLSSVIRWMATQTGVAWTYRQEALLFSAKPLSGASVTRIYDVSALTAPVRDFPGPELAFSSAGIADGGLKAAPEARADSAQNLDEIADFLRRQLHID